LAYRLREAFSWHEKKEVGDRISPERVEEWAEDEKPKDPEVIVYVQNADIGFPMSVANLVLNTGVKGVERP